MITTLVNTAELILTNIRTPKMSENETGADIVLVYKDVEGNTVRVYGQKDAKQKRAWIPEEQENYPDDAQGLLLLSSNVIDTWAESSIKHAKDLFC